jgi:hypothetical protein
MTAWRDRFGRKKRLKVKSAPTRRAGLHPTVPDLWWIMLLAGVNLSTPFAYAVDVLLLLFGIAVGTDFRHVPLRIHSIMGIAWIRMGEQRGFSGLARIYVFPGTLPFRAVRVNLTIIGVVGGILALLIGPH